MGEQKLIIDFLREDDNDAVLDLSHRCIQQGVISVYPDRTPVFNRIHKQLDSESFHLVARQGDKLIGCIGAIYTPVNCEGKVFRSVYLLDFKVDPEFQKGMTAYRLVKETFDFLFGKNEQMGFAMIIKGNNASHIFTRGRAGFPGSSNIGDIQVNNIIPFRKRKTDPRFSFDHPSEGDIREMVNLYQQFYKNYKLAPQIDEDLFRLYIGEIEGMGLENFWVARENGKIRAILCAWDENIYKRWHIIRIPLWMKMVFRLIRIMSVFMKMPASIKAGQTLRQKTLVMIAHDSSIEALASLIRHVNNNHLGSEYTVLQTHFHKEDEMAIAQKGLLGLKVEIEAHMMTADPELARRIADTPGPVLFEWPVYV